ncbi:hypothetical protein OG21DRAFT_1510418 [Imleria badia]|nr:hypothetical protein OG21DRAFT_1510418 [Imleria badia]
MLRVIRRNYRVAAHLDGASPVGSSPTYGGPVPAKLRIGLSASLCSSREHARSTTRSWGAYFGRVGTFVHI